MALVLPDFDPRWIVHRDAHYVVVDKPAGMLSIEREQGGQSALVTRLAHHLGLSAPLAVLSRLDAETSGLIAFPLSEAARTAMSRATEAHALDKRYVAAVELAPGRRVPAGRMEDVLVERDGRVEVAPASRGGKAAVAHATLIERRQARALVEVRLETGRTHQIRVQLASRGAPIAGDSVYGAVPGPRLLLAATAITLPHPERGAFTLRASVPPSFASWLHGALDPETWLATALPVATERRHALLRAQDGTEATTAFRLFSEEGDGVSGLAVDVYGEHLVVQLHDPVLEESRILDQLAHLGARGIYVKRRPRAARDLASVDVSELAPPAPVRGEPAQGELIVREHGMPFLVRLGDGLSTGLFLEPREDRARVPALAAGKRVLNLFAYTCGFTVAAALGGARETLSVDASQRALDRGRANLALSGFEGAAHRLTADDAFDVLARLRKRTERFDLVCVDPPTFSTTKRSRWTSGKDWARLAEAVLSVVAEGGSVIATSNDRRMTQGTFRKHLRDGAAQAGVPLGRLVDLAPPLDFRAGPGESPPLKGLLVERGSG